MSGGYTDGSELYGPAVITCPYCTEEFEVPAGPTPRCDVTHPECDGGRIIVDLVAESAGRSRSLNTGNDQSEADDEQ